MDEGIAIFEENSSRREWGDHYPEWATPCRNSNFEPAPYQVGVKSCECRLILLFLFFFIYPKDRVHARFRGK